MRRTLPLLVLLLAFSGCGEPTSSAPKSEPEPEEWIRPFDGFLPGEAPEDTAVFRVVDVQTGRPIPGAVVQQHYEIHVGPEGWAPLIREARTDRYGLVSITRSEDEPYRTDCHWVVRADGYVAMEDYGYAPGATIELGRPFTRHGRIVDALGRPLAGMKIGYKEGCGHSPFLMTTTTDNDGVFVISGVDFAGDIFYAARGALGSYFRGSLRSLEETPHTDVATPAIRVHGRILGADPSDLGPRLVHARAEQRGTFGRVEDDGTFVIDGAEIDGVLTLSLDPQGSIRELSLEFVRPRGPFVWDLRHGERDPTESTTVADRTLRVLVTTPEGKRAEDFSVAAYRTIDGRTQAEGTDMAQYGDPEHPGVVDLALLPGTYDIVVGNDGERWHADPVRVDIGKEEPEPLVIKARSFARFELVWPGTEVDEVRWRLSYAGADGFIDHEELLGENGVYLPPDAPARVAVPGEGVMHWFDVGPPLDGVRRATVTLPRPRTIRFRSDREPDDGITIGDEGHEAVKTKEGYEITTELVGHFEFVVRQEDGRGDEPLPSVRRMIDLTGPEVIDLGELVWPKTARGTLTIVDAGGQPVVDERVKIYGPEPSRTDGPITTHHPFTDEAGQTHSALLQTGSWFTFETEDHDYHQVLEGPGPWTLRLGAATVEVEVHGRYGILTDAALMLDGAMHDRAGEYSEDRRPARFAVRALKAGPHVLLVTAPGHRGEARRIVLRHGETRRLRIDLPERD